MKAFLLAALLFSAAVPSFSAENDFVEEPALKQGLLDMLARFSLYMKNNWQPIGTCEGVGEALGCFKGEHTMGSDERGVRTNADLTMICAFLGSYAKGKVELPEGVSWTDLHTMARQGLAWALATHKANRLIRCADGRYWGSLSVSDHSWESSLWALSVAYAAFFQWNELSPELRVQLYKLLTAECQYELERTIPTGYKGDTKAEENGWEAGVLAVTLGLFPDDERAPEWFERLRAFAINSYSHPSDATCATIIDPAYNSTTVAQLYAGPNLYPDYTLQNHNLFHTSYQNVVQQELGEAALALKLFQTQLHGHERWATQALFHHLSDVQRHVLNPLALADGELAMPNGNDWSLFLFDQITSYSTLACFLGDADALMLESKAYHNILARQATTTDGSFLLRPDVGARRMGVEGHRVMMTYLMHHLLSTASLQPTSWPEFRARHAGASMLPSQRVVRAFTQSRFSCFSWSEGLKSYTGYFAPNDPQQSKIVVPYRAYNTGNYLGHSLVEGHTTNAVPAAEPLIITADSSYLMAGNLYTNDSTLLHQFALYSTPGNALLYIDQATARTDLTLTAQRGGLLAISTDPFTQTTRTLSYEGAQQEFDGSGDTTFATSWMNIDGQIGIITPAQRQMRFGEREPVNSILTAKLYALADDQPRALTKGQTAFRRAAAYYAQVSATTTAQLASQADNLSASLPEGWNGIAAADPDGTLHLLIASFTADAQPNVDIRTRGIRVQVKNSRFTLTNTTGQTIRLSAALVTPQQHALGQLTLKKHERQTMEMGQ